jgi:hypothetical protein
MREWDNGLDEVQCLEAFTLGGGLAKNAQPAVAAGNAKSRVQKESLRRTTPISRRKSKPYTSPPRRETERNSALVQKTLTAGTIRITEADAAENSPAKKGGWLDGLKGSHDFPALLRHAMHINPAGIPPVESVEAKSGVADIRVQVPAQPAAQNENNERNEPTCSIRIVLPVRSALRLKALVQSLTSAWNWTQQQLKSRQTRKRLRICESVSLGEKRFVAVIEVDGKQFLLGGSPTSLTTIARLDPLQKMADALDPGWTQSQVQA